MESTTVLFSLALAFLFFSGAHTATFTFNNNCPYTVWPGALTGGGGAQVTPTGFELTANASNSITIPPPWSGRFWARTQCSSDPSGKFTCATADCASGQVACNGAGAVPPASLVEFFLAPYGGTDFYDVSLVDGFNLPISITPQGGAGGCSATSCPKNINEACPAEVAVKGSDGSVVACKSACLALNEPQYCCTGEYGTPDKCPPTKFSKVFKEQCPQAYSYAYDDKTSTFTCAGGPNYVIAFCP